MEKESKPAYKDPFPAEYWEIWYTDIFDRDARAIIDVQGRGLVKGLAELWARHFFETVTIKGQQGFSSFQMRCKAGNIIISGDWEGAKRIRSWLFGGKVSSYQGYVAEADAWLLFSISYVHAHLIRRDQSAEQILALAVIANDRQDFENRLHTLIEK